MLFTKQKTVQGIRSKYQRPKYQLTKILTEQNINFQYPGASICWDRGRLVGTQSFCAPFDKVLPSRCNFGC